MGLETFFTCEVISNPHIRTTAFFIKAENLLELNVNKKINKKINTNYFEEED